MRNALGKNAEGLSNPEIIKRYTNITSAYINNDMRYGIPAYMENVIRETKRAKIFIDNDVYSLVNGEVGVLFYENEDKYVFQGDFLSILVVFKNECLDDFHIGYQVQDQRLSKRISDFKIIEKCLSANRLTIYLDGKEQKTITLPLAQSGKMWSDKDEIIEMMHFWIDGLNKLRVIEEHYGIQFILNPVNGAENINELYNAIDLVYCGIMLKPNCSISYRKTNEEKDLVIPQPILIEEEVDIPLPKRTIHGIAFKPVTSALLPGTIPFGSAKKGEILYADACCLYRMVE